MGPIFTDLLKYSSESILEWILSATGMLFEGMAKLVFYLDRALLAIGIPDFYGTLVEIFFNVGMWIIIIKYLKKGYETYILWTEGDPDASPILLLTRFLKASIVALVFPILYNALADISLAVIELISSSLAITARDATILNDWLEFQVGFLSAFLFLAFLVVYMILYFQMLGRGIQLILLRAGAPLACVGLIESDNGVFRPYILKIFQCALTTIFQLVAIQLGMGIFLSAGSSDLAISFAPIIGLMFLVGALKTPAILQEFMIQTSSSSGVGGKVYGALRVADVARTLVR